MQAVKKGIYVAGPAIEGLRVERFLIANHLLGPSYVSVETALSHYGMIPERVHEIASMTTKASRMFETPLGTFSYTHLPLPYYAYGLDSAQLAADQCTIIASPEKALCDKIVATKGVIFRSEKGVREYLIDGMRMDEERLNALDTDRMTEWLPHAPKSESLAKMIDMITRL